jgi:hypothetical protein
MYSRSTNFRLTFKERIRLVKQRAGATLAAFWDVAPCSQAEI